MNLIALINSEMLYTRALSEQVPYFKFATWIESTVQKEVIKVLFQAKKGAKGAIPDDLIVTDKKQGANSSKNQMGSQIMAFLQEKTKNIKMPKMPSIQSLGAK